MGNLTSLLMSLSCWRMVGSVKSCGEHVEGSKPLDDAIPMLSPDIMEAMLLPEGYPSIGKFDISTLSVSSAPCKDDMSSMQGRARSQALAMIMAGIVGFQALQW